MRQGRKLAPAEFLRHLFEEKGPQLGHRSFPVVEQPAIDRCRDPCQLFIVHLIEMIRDSLCIITHRDLADPGQTFKIIIDLKYALSQHGQIRFRTEAFPIRGTIQFLQGQTIRRRLHCRDPDTAAIRKIVIPGIIIIKSEMFRSFACISGRNIGQRFRTCRFDQRTQIFLIKGPAARDRGPGSGS